MPRVVRVAVVVGGVGRHSAGTGTPDWLAVDAVLDVVRMPAGLSNDQNLWMALGGVT